MKQVKIILASLILAAFTTAVNSESAAEKAKDKRIENLHYLVFLEVPMKNFGTDAQKEKLKEIKKDYTKGLSFFFEGDYLQSYLDFITVQKKLEKLYEELSLNYITRTTELLQDSNSKVVDITIKYHKKSERVKRFLRDRDVSRKPPELQPYDPQNFHLTYHKKPITDNIELGYKRVGDAKRIRQQAMDVEKYLENNKKLTPSMRKMRIEHYMAAIRLCREGKLNAIKVYQLISANENYTVQTTYKDNYYSVEKRLNPVFDQRIPEKYRIDANDSHNRIHAEEICLKKDLKNPKDCRQAQDT